MRDRISDSMEHGLSHDDAFAGAVESLGNLDELIDTITRYAEESLREQDELVHDGRRNCIRYALI